MESTEKEITRKLKKHLKGITAATLDALAKRLGVLPAERMLLTTDIGISLAALNLRAAVEMMKASPEVSRLIDASDMRIWGEIGKRLDFLLQELNREANTVLSKSTEVSIKDAGLVIKAEVEKLREQVQNVE